MRYLHPVQMHEKFVASGEYAIYAHGFSTQVVEAWSIHALTQTPGDESWFVRVDSDWRNDTGALILGEALISPEANGYRVERVDLERYQSSPGKPLAHYKENYSFFDTYLQVGYAAPAAERRYAEQPMDVGYVTAPRWRYFHLLTGFAAATLARNATLERAAFTGFDTATPTATFQTAQVTIRHERRETLTVGFQKVEADVYTMTHAGQYTTDQPEQSLTLWLDRHGILLRQSGGLYDVSLIQYARRPDPKPNP